MVKLQRQTAESLSSASSPKSINGHGHPIRPADQTGSFAFLLINIGRIGLQ